ncbi:GT4 family glycosyltransferase PelF [Kallotenue papyrolyticum]|uniref:GT4 family glycosyltransferase PelF n=1 Tax=Kallotenue papyrolyticum TaxID=1325125 RepID=UPI00047857AF|nr:GT4 family glycosyltransferase PelF [Kallotenue papyrolyticum]
MTRALHVVLTTEGTYPFHEGGVSTWCDALIRHLPNVHFTLVSLSAQPGLRTAYQLPSNVIEHRPIALWGTAGARDLDPTLTWSTLARRRARLWDRRARRRWHTAWNTLLEGLFLETDGWQQLAHGVREVARCATLLDYDSAFRLPETWELFTTVLARAPQPNGVPPSAWEWREALHLLYRWLTPLAVPLPRCDLLHASAAGLACLPAVVAHLEHGTPLILTEHGVYLRERYLAWHQSDCHPWLRQVALQVTRRLVELSYGLATTIAPVCGWNVRWEQRLGADPERITVVPNGVDPRRFEPQPFPAAERPTLVWVGRIDPLKDLLTLIEAAAHLRAALPEVQVLLFGKAPAGNQAYEQACRARVTALGLDQTVRWMGFASSPAAAYAQGHVVVLSSISEAMPYSVIEAMFCGRPVVGTAVGSVAEIIGPAGRVVTPRDPAALAAACLELLRDPALCAELGRVAREHALAHYTLEHAVGGYARLYHRLARPATDPLSPSRREGWLGWLRAGLPARAPREGAVA